MRCIELAGLGEGVRLEELRLEGSHGGIYGFGSTRFGVMAEQP